MAAPPKRPIPAKRLQGFRYFRMLGPLLDRLRDAGTQVEATVDELAAVHGLDHVETVRVVAASRS